MGKTYRIELCMKYDTCKRCPKNKQCEAEYKKQEEKRSSNENKKNLGGLDVSNKR